MIGLVACFFWGHRFIPVDGFLYICSRCAKIWDTLPEDNK